MAESEKFVPFNIYELIVKDRNNVYISIQEFQLLLST